MSKYDYKPQLIAGYEGPGGALYRSEAAAIAAFKSDAWQKAVIEACGKPGGVWQYPGINRLFEYPTLVAKLKELL